MHLVKLPKIYRTRIPSSKQQNHAPGTPCPHWGKNSGSANVIYELPRLGIQKFYKLLSQASDVIYFSRNEKKIYPPHVHVGEYI